MSMKTKKDVTRYKVGYDLSKIITKKHEGKWVALSKDYKKIIAFSEDVLKLEKMVKGNEVIYLRPLRSDTQYCFNGVV